MPTVDIDFETYKAITARRTHESVTEGQVIREAFGLPLSPAQRLTPIVNSGEQVWISEGVRFQVGAKLRHVFRGGKLAEAEIVAGGVRVGESVFPGLSPAAAYGAGHQANGWQFWEVLQSDGRWIKADALRNR